jgi:hypothetical protein
VRHYCPKHPYAADRGGVCSFCAKKLEMPYVSWWVVEEWIGDTANQAAGTVVGGHLFVCSNCLWVRGGFLEDLEHLAELNGYPRASMRQDTPCVAGGLPVADGGRDC